MQHPKATPGDQRVFQEKIKQYEDDKRSIVYIDESGFATDMPRTHGYAPCGARCFGTHDWQAKGRTNVLGALLLGVLLTVSLTSSNVDSDIFNTWLQHDLLPKLPEHCVLVMDNAAFHKRADMRAMIEKAGHTLEFLPPYSPHLNPIEKKWAQAKAKRRKTGDNIDDLFAKPF